MELPVQILPHGTGLPLPAYHSDHASGLDLRAAVAEPLTLPPGGRALIPTGLAIAVAVGYEAQVRPRSGLALDHGITCLNTPGTIDADPFTVARGDRIAQLVVTPVVRPQPVPVAALPPTGRGNGGFGHTGRA